MQWHREDLWYLLHIFSGIKYWIFFILAMLWMRLLLMVMENMTTSRRSSRHTFVQPLARMQQIKRSRTADTVDVSEKPKVASKDSASRERTLILRLPSRSSVALSTISSSRRLTIVTGEKHSLSEAQLCKYDRTG